VQMIAGSYWRGETAKPFKNNTVMYIVAPQQTCRQSSILNLEEAEFSNPEVQKFFNTHILTNSPSTAAILTGIVTTPLRNFVKKLNLHETKKANLATEMAKTCVQHYYQQWQDRNEMVPHHPRPKPKKHPGAPNTKIKTKEQDGSMTRSKTPSKRTRIGKQEAWYKERTETLQRAANWNQWNFKRKTGKRIHLNMKVVGQKQPRQAANSNREEAPSSSSTDKNLKTAAAGKERETAASQREGKDNHKNSYQEKIDAHVTPAPEEKWETTVVLPEHNFIDDTTESDAETAERAPPRQLYPVDNQLQQMCRPLQRREKTRLKEILNVQYQDDDHIVISGTNVLRRKDMKQCFDMSYPPTSSQIARNELYLSDVMIDCFLNQTAIRGIANQHRVLCINPLYKVLTKSPEDAWEFLQRTAIRHIEMESLHSILIPVNTGGNHWVLTHVDLQTNTIAIYDSLQGGASSRRDDPRHKIKAFLTQHHQLAQKPWRIINTQNFPQQGNGYDCGVFTCAAALAIITKQPMHFNQRSIQAFREQMAIHLIDDSTTQSHVKDLRRQRVQEWEGERVGGDHLGQGGQGSPTTPTIVRGAMEPTGVSLRRPSAALFESNSGSNLQTSTRTQPRQVPREDKAAPSKSTTKSSPRQQTLQTTTSFPLPTQGTDGSTTQPHVKDLRNQRVQGSPTVPTAACDATKPTGVGPRRPSVTLVGPNSVTKLLTSTPVHPRHVPREDKAAPAKSTTKNSPRQQTLQNTKGSPRQQTLLTLWTADPRRHNQHRGRREEEERGEGGQLRVRRGLPRSAPSIARGAVDRTSGAHLRGASRPTEQSAGHPTSRRPTATQDQQPKNPSKGSTGQERPAATPEAYANTEPAIESNTSARLPPKARRTPRGRQPIKRKQSPERATLQEALRSTPRAATLHRQAAPVATLPRSTQATRSEASDAPT